MSTNRTPINRTPRARITRRAVDLFRQMQAVSDDSDEWDVAHFELWKELRLQLFEWPAVVAPHERIYEGWPGCAGAEWVPQARKLYAELSALAGANERQQHDAE